MAALVEVGTVVGVEDLEEVEVASGAMTRGQIVDPGEAMEVLATKETGMMVLAMETLMENMETMVETMETIRIIEDMKQNESFAV